MSEFLNRKKVRESLIRYFKIISKCQKQIQTVQQQLITHPRFNPIVLYKKIAGGEKMTSKDLKQYWRKKIGIKREDGLKMYMIKYDLKRKDLNQEITVQMFLETLLPYTPNCLREVSQTILRQLQTQHIDITVQSLYHKLISITTSCLYLILLLQRQINLSSWQKVQAFMVQDIVEKGKRIDLTIKETADVIYVRKWMELWVNVDEYEVLNMMRFFNGGNEVRIAKIFDNDVNIQMKCTCQGHESKETLKIKNARSQSKSQKKTLNQDYFSSTQSQKSKNRSKLRFYTQTQGPERNQNKQILKQQGQNKNANESSEVQQISTFESKQQKTPQRRTEVSLFLSYITNLVENEKQIHFNRTILFPYKKQIEEILHDMLSKKKSWTKCQKILLYIERFLGLKKEKFEKIIVDMGNVKIDNSVVFALFNSHEKKGSDKVEKNKQKSTQQIMKNIASILFKFISTRRKLTILSTELIYVSMDHMITNILQSIQKERRKAVKLKIQDIKEFFTKNTQKSLGKQYLTLIMNHLGDGTEITSKSLIKVFHKQAQIKKSD